MAAKNGCTEAARLLLAHGAFVEAKANVCFHGTMLSVFVCFKLRTRTVENNF
jgi:ankyrin repeat protein